MNREVHVRFCEGVGVKFPRATRPLIHTRLGSILAQYVVSQMTYYSLGDKYHSINSKVRFAN